MEQHSSEWFNERRPRITGSIAGAILGLDPNKTRKQVMIDKVTEWNNIEQVRNEFLEDVIFKWGKQCEPMAVADLEILLNDDIKPAPLVVSETRPWLAASPDGTLNGDPVEIKCPYGLRNKKPVFKTAAELPHYYAQMQIEMFCLRRKKCHFYQWTPQGDYYELVEYNSTWMREALRELKAFYDEFVRIRDTPDEVMTPEIDTPEVLTLLAEYDEIKISLDMAKQRQEDIVAELAKIAGDKSAILCGRKFTLCERKGSVAYAKVVKKHLPDLDLTEYTGKPSKFWKLT